MFLPTQWRNQTASSRPRVEGSFHWVAPVLVGVYQSPDVKVSDSRRRMVSGVGACSWKVAPNNLSLVWGLLHHMD